MDETKTTQPTPEQLLKLLDAQLDLARNKRTGGNASNRVALLASGLLLIVVAGCVALLVLQQMLSELRPEPGATNSQTEQSTAGTGDF